MNTRYAMKRYRGHKHCFLPRIVLVVIIAYTLVVQPSTALAISGQGKSTLRFNLKLDAQLQKKPYSGRVYVVLSKQPEPEPRRSMSRWINPPQIFALDVVDVRPGEPITITHGCLSNPATFAKMARGKYWAQAVARRSLDSPVAGQGPGDLYSAPRKVDLGLENATSIDFTLDRVVQPRPFNETENLRYFEMLSPSLSKFHGREVTIRAGVILPEAWDDHPATRYPVLYWIGGFGGSHHSVKRLARMFSGILARQVLIVVPDSRCYRGHSVFADSANNGPWGEALVEELAPALDKQFRGAKGRRFVTGISSGGWSSLWLQVTYPDAFQGCWAHVPDPVDFRDFQRINLYKPGVNMFVDVNGNRRPLARRGDEVMLWYDDFVRIETVLGPGGQIHSFEAVFSKRGLDGNPEPLFDRDTGEIDTTVAHSWEKYDIRLILEKNWTHLAPKLAGKLHIYAGGQDTFYLEGAVRLLKKSLEKLGSDAEVKILPEMAHNIHQESVEPMFQAILGHDAQPNGAP